MAPPEEWTLVANRHGKGRKHKHKHKHKSANKVFKTSIQDDIQAQDHSYTEEDKQELLKRMNTCLSKLQNSQFYTAFTQQIQTPEFTTTLQKITDHEITLRMVIYGIGSIENSENSRLQFSLAVLMAKNLEWVGGMEAFDPIINPLERSVMESFGCHILSKDEQGQRRAEKPTLFFMPHCESFLYNNLLKVNWHNGDYGIGNIVLLGNSFGEYAHQCSYIPKDSDAFIPSHVLAIAEQCQEYAVDTVSEEFFKAFNGTSWHFFSHEDGDASLLNNRLGNVDLAS